MILRGILNARRRKNPIDSAPFWCIYSSAAPLTFGPERPSGLPARKRKCYTPRMWFVSALYRFVTINDVPALRARVKAVCAENDICGTLLLAPEGINGTVGAPSAEKRDALMDFLSRELDIFKGEVKYSDASEKPFRRMKVRLKKEIVTLRAPEADPNVRVGKYVDAQEWNTLISAPGVTVLDTRNIYETEIGIFRDAIDPRINTFTEFKDFVAKNLSPETHPKIAMFCTGGIRCEKASAYMLAHGYQEVYHLKGGILKYLETVPETQSLWDGGCFVFDRRVAIGHGLKETSHEPCYGCRYPLNAEERQSPHYEEGVCCPHCYQSLTPARADVLRQRHQQMKTQVQ